MPGRVRWAVEQVAAAGPARVLEVGSGPGHAAALLLARMPAAQLTAIDRSALQVERTRARGGALVAAGRLRVERLALEDAPGALGEAGFDAVLAVNVNAFWTAPGPALGALARLLAPGGRAWLAYEPPGAGPGRAVRERLGALLPRHGFAVEAVHEADLGPGRGLCFVARR